MERNIINWGEPKIPQSVVMAIPIDRNGSMLIQHRSPNVRSAPNVWSFPSGMQELGECIEDAASRELLEELNLEARRMRMLGHYDNIAGDSPEKLQYHWSITIVGCLVDDVKLASNLEPDKHDSLLCCNYLELASIKFWMVYPFHRAFNSWAINNCMRLVADLQELIR